MMRNIPPAQTAFWERALAFAVGALGHFRSVSPWRFFMLCGVGAAAVLFLSVITFGIPRFVSRTLPVPGVFACGRLTSSLSLWTLVRGVEATNGEDDVDALRSAEDIAARDLCLERLARDLDVRVTDDDVRTLQMSGDAQTEFMAKAHWSSSDYDRFVVRPLALAQKLEGAVYASDESQTSARERLQLLVDKLDLGIAFADVAQQYSEDASRQSAGSLGYVHSADLDAAFAPAFSLGIGERTAILDVGAMLWIVRLDDVLTTDGDTVYKLRGIAVRKNGVDDAVAELLRQHVALSFVR